MSAPIEEPSALLFARAVAMHGGTLSKGPVGALVEMIDSAHARADTAEATVARVRAVALSVLRASMEGKRIIHDAGIMQDVIEQVCSALGMDIEAVGWDAVIQDLEGKS